MSDVSTKGPAVALESTVIAHGLPQPVNLETARRLESIVRESGARPLTIAIVNGELCAGLTDDQLTSLANDSGVQKISKRDIPIAVAHGWTGGTTVSATLWICLLYTSPSPRDS